MEGFGELLHCLGRNVLSPRIPWLNGRTMRLQLSCHADAASNKSRTAALMMAGTELGESYFRRIYHASA